MIRNAVDIAYETHNLIQEMYFSIIELTFLWIVFFQMTHHWWLCCLWNIGITTYTGSPLCDERTHKRTFVLSTRNFFFSVLKNEFIFSFNFLSCSNNPIPLIILCLAFILYFHHFMIHLKLTGWELWPLFWQIHIRDRFCRPNNYLWFGVSYLKQR